MKDALPIEMQVSGDSTYHSTFPDTQHARSLQRMLGCRLFNGLISGNDGMEVELSLFVLLPSVVGLLFIILLLFITLVNFYTHTHTYINTDIQGLSRRYPAM